MNEEPQPIVDNPIIVIQRIKDERENIMKPIKGRLEEKRILLFGAESGRITKVREQITNSSDFRKLDPCVECLNIFDRIYELMQDLFDIKTNDDNAFNTLYEYVETMFKEEKKEDGIIDLEKELLIKDTQLKEKEKELEKTKEEDRDLLLANMTPRDLLEEKAKKDKSVRIVIDKIKKRNKLVWDKLAELNATAKLMEDVEVNENALPVLGIHDWEIMKKYKMILEVGEDINGEKIGTQRKGAALCGIGSTKMGEMMKYYDSHINNPQFKAMVINVVIEDEIEFSDRLEKIKQEGVRTI